MISILLIIETPTLSDSSNFTSQCCSAALTALSELTKKDTNLELLTGNVLQIAIEQELDTLTDVIGILKKDGVGRYKYVVLPEPLKVSCRDTKQN